jgi:hypothetical protein
MECIQANNMQIFSGQPGKNPYYSTLSSYHITLPVNSANVVTDYTGAETMFRFFIGNQEQNVDASHLVTFPSSGSDVTYSLANEVGGKGVVFTVTNVADYVDSQELVTIRYTLGGVNYEQVYALTKSIATENIDSCLVSSQTDIVYAVPSTTEQLVKAIRIPAGTMKASGDILEFSVQIGSINQITDGMPFTSYVNISIDGLVLINCPFYHLNKKTVTFKIDYNNLILETRNESGSTNPSINMSLRSPNANTKLGFTSIDWSVDNFINVVSFIDAASIHADVKVPCKEFKLEYKHNLNSH